MGHRGQSARGCCRGGLRPPRWVAGGGGSKRHMRRKPFASVATGHPPARSAAGSSLARFGYKWPHAPSTCVASVNLSAFVLFSVRELPGLATALVAAAAADRRPHHLASNLAVLPRPRRNTSLASGLLLRYCRLKRLLLLGDQRAVALWVDERGCRVLRIHLGALGLQVEEAGVPRDEDVRLQ